MQKTCPDWLFGGGILDLREVARISWGFSVGWSCRCSNPGSSGCNAPSKGHWPPEGWLGTKMEDLGDPEFFGWINFYQILLSIHKNQLFWIILVSTRGVQGFDPTPNRTLGTFHVSIQLVEYPILIHAIPCPGACVLYARKISMLRTPVQ